MRLSLSNGPYAMEVDPQHGGSVTMLGWQDQRIFRPHTGNGVLGSSCFPLVPFSNRIAGSRFAFSDTSVQLQPNHPEEAGEPVLHGFGWVASWDIVEAESDRAVLRLEHSADQWPWDFCAEHSLSLCADHAFFGLRIENRSDRPMPAGLGFHPYFPRSANTVYHGLHRGEWANDAQCLPTALDDRAAPIDWWNGAPVGTRSVDTVYTARSGPLTISWPDRNLAAVIEPSPDLAFTTVYVPDGEEFFCAEPVTHMTDAFNRSGHNAGTRVLAPGEVWSVSMVVRAGRLADQ
ncbi:aldose 1-epimerase [Qipengyuania marisflavi]|uniref:Aldose 1-epimerase n=1 Tax=Qipengyuania marisflavi TaxID=2486356 RepID=A0A5S3P0H2_9SPHN|nr:aldose 1-epimerase [Qipengyuania marisflavi]TMM46254.1 aldose 1-epimerase [Qipengyuania marisflavi]